MEIRKLPVKSIAVEVGGGENQPIVKLHKAGIPMGQFTLEELYSELDAFMESKKIISVAVNLNGDDVPGHENHFPTPEQIKENHEAACNKPEGAAVDVQE